FRLLTESSSPTVVGKAWWNESLQLAAGGDGRRVIIGVVGAFVGLQVVSGVCGVVGAIASSGGGGDDTRTERQRALKMQQTYGWSFGAADDVTSMTVPGSGGGMLGSEAAQLSSHLTPKNPALAPSYVPTLFDAVTARPTQPGDSDLRGGSGSAALADVLRTMDTPAMQAAAADARWLKQLLGTQSLDVAVVVDLPGPASVAFAAELADRYDPVFCFDNWPHPRGVVRAHETLSAAASLLPAFDKKKAARTGNEPPVFVLDRLRLSPYVDESNSFDNRSVARLPNAATLQKLGIKHVLYIAPSGSVPVDLDDVNGDLVGWASAGLDVRTVDFAEWYAVKDKPDAIFAMRYGLYTAHPPTEPVQQTTASSWRPTPRSTPFAVAGSPTLRTPTGFGEVPVVVSVASGAMLGAMMYRSGSWNRTTSSYYGGG
ncbi:MAG TPA: hypothetical protein VGF99_20160, partial [Myxococcota bacterium]